MDIATMIVDILRRKKEEAALNQGGLVAGTQAAKAAAPGLGAALPRGIEPKHGGKTYEEIIDSYGAGR